jgi:hypothetical protein
MEIPAREKRENRELPSYCRKDGNLPVIPRYRFRAMFNIKKKNKVINNFSGIDSKKVVIVVSEIESWYLSGVNIENCRKMKICKFLPDTNCCTKEQFIQLIPEDVPKIEFMNDMLDVFDTELGKKRNKSFKYFMDKFVCLNLTREC